MATSHGCCEIVEANEELDIQPKMSGKECLPQQGHFYSIEDDINRLFQAIDIKTSVGGDTLHKNPMKRPMRGNAPQASGIGISESVNLKQALRRLCLSQASEIAAMKRRSLRSAVASSPVSNGGAMKRLYRAVVVEANDSGESVNEDKRNIVEISLPGKVMPNHYAEGPASTNVSCSGSSNQGSRSSAVFPGSAAIKAKMMRAPSPDKVVPLPSDAVDDLPNEESERERKLKQMQSKHGACTIKKVLEEGDIFPNKEMLKKSVQEAKQLNDALHPESYPNSSTNCNKMKKSLSNSPQLGTPVFRNKNFIKKKTKLVSMSDSSASVPGKGNSSSNLLNSAAKLVVSQTEECATDAGTKAINRLSSTFSGESIRVGVSLTEPIVSELDILKVGDGASVSTLKTDGKAKLREKGEISQSSKSSIGDYSCSTSNSGASSLSGSSCWGNRPHMSKDLRWDVVQRIQKQHGNLNLKHFQLLKRLGSGDIGTVYLAELVSTSCMFALKVMDNEFLTRRKKLLRAQTEREILQMLDHPFLPTLYAHCATDKLSCLVMDYCPGGDLHVLRQRQPCRSFSEHSARFYVAEVLLALEYLHMLGVVYRDLKPENVLVREDGHIMLSDFDLSLRCIVNPTIYRSSSPNLYPPKKVSSPCLESSCIDPFCLQPSWQVSCFTPRLLTAASKSRKVKADQHVHGVALPQLIAEPTDARSNSFVGTHEYLAPEIVKGEGHGSSVDWWTFGIFLYELLYGKTPFKGSNNEETLANVVSQPLKFPASPIVSFHARNLIRGLLIKEPENRLGSLKGAAEIKQHPFFEGLNWALIRCAQPPERPRLYDIGLGGDPSAVSHKNRSGKLLECNSDRIEFELF